MDWHEFTQMLGDAATSPAMPLICALIVFVAGVACGSLCRLAVMPEAIADDEAGDTHARFTFGTRPEPPPSRLVRESQALPRCQCQIRPVNGSARIQQIDSSACLLHSLTRPAARRGS